ncbi:hypothetical protein SBA3_3660019 [Candidatus Sulfopaludibacter sp. SbA3]|nr:hypothetical protein SBA3_3660019 [Candidatus Sulfopaludibacter sp. SbA3]
MTEAHADTPQSGGRRLISPLLRNLLPLSKMTYNPKKTDDKKRSSVPLGNQKNRRQRSPALPGAASPHEPTVTVLPLHEIRHVAL